MAFSDSQLKSSLGLCLGTAISAVLLIQVFNSVSQQKNTRNLPPTAPYSPWYIVKQYHGPSVTFFDLELVRQLQTPAVRLQLPFGNEVYLIMDHNLALQILQDPKNDKADNFKAFELTTGGLPSLLTVPTMSSVFQPRRKAIAHAMAPIKLNKKVGVVERKLDDLFVILEKAAADRTPVDIDSLFIRLTLDIVSLSFFGYDLCAMSGDHASEGSRFIEEFELAGAEVQKRIMDSFQKWKFWKPEVRRAKQASRWILDLGLRIIDHYRCHSAAKNIDSEDSFVASLLSNKSYPDDDARAAEVANILIGGFDTVAHTLSWTLYEISKHVDIQSALQAELDQLPDYPSLSQLNQSSLLNGCLKEGMRLWPVAGESSYRKIHADVEANGMVIPRNATVIMAYHAMFRQVISEDPDDFRPARWLQPSPELKASFIPFSAGVRNCVGQNLANLELRVALAYVMRRFSFSVAQEPTYHFVFLAKPQGLLLHVTKRI